MDIVVASNNQGKIREIKEILNGYNILSLKEAKIDTDVEEDKDTFVENAKKKAETIAKLLNSLKWCMADDSGIKIEYLDGFPGVYSKRWHAGTDRERNLAIIEKMKRVPKEKRKMTFVSAMAISNGDETIIHIGELKGYVAEEPRGENGFGFDEIFELENGKTLAEITLEEKNMYSARKKVKEKYSYE